MRATGLVVLTGLLLVAGVRSALAVVDVAVSAEDGTVYVDARAGGFLGPELDEALRSGLPAVVDFELVVWERRAALWDREVLRADWEVRVLFDLIDEAYRVYDAEGEQLLRTTDPGALEEFVGGIELWPLCPVADLDAAREHYLAVRFSIEPLSIEEVRDLERWLRGNVRQGARLRDVPGQLIGVLRNRLGLGGHDERGRSDPFSVGALPLPD